MRPPAGLSAAHVAQDRPVENAAGAAGVRSVAFHDHLLSSGSGHGKVSFYDLRANDYLHMDEGSLQHPPRDNLQIGPGWLKEDHIYRCGAPPRARAAPAGWRLTDLCVPARRQYFQDAGPLPNACYTHAWDPVSTRMFCAGGPLAFGLKGAYMGLWA